MLEPLSPTGAVVPRPTSPPPAAASPAGVPEPAALAPALAERGVTTVLGSLVNPAGLALGKVVPLARLGGFATSGLGASQSWSVFCIDGGLGASDRFGAVGDLRLRLDASALAVLGGPDGAVDRFAWAPVDVVDQAGAPVDVCTRGALRRLEGELAAEGLTALVGHELEFVLVGADERPVPSPWVPYGVGSLLAHDGFVADLHEAAAAAGAPLEQVHAEYAPGQFEFSLPPAAPVAAADRVALARLVTSAVARRHGLRVSFAPVAHAGAPGGSGAHQHVSLARGGVPLLSGGPGPHGLTRAGEAAISGLVTALPGMQGVLAGSVLSPARLVPGAFAGAHACWGLENREAAVRLVTASPGNPSGANVEVKCIDPSANTYLATALVLGAALAGIRAGAPALAEVTVDPGTLDAAEAALGGVVLLPQTQAEVLERFAASALVRDVLGAALVDAVLAVRTHELDTWGGAGLEELTDRFRFAWTS